jgi:hypothetical protein
VPLDLDGLSAYIEPQHPSNASVRAYEPHQNADGTCFPGAVGPEEPEHLTTRHVGIDPAQRLNATEMLRHSIEEDCRIVHAAS